MKTNLTRLLCSLLLGSSTAQISVAADSFLPGLKPSIGLSSQIVRFVALNEGTNPPPLFVSVVNRGFGKLTGLTTSIIYSNRTPTGWLSAKLDRAYAPAMITLQTRPGTLKPGTYLAAVAVSSLGADNSPQYIGVSFKVGACPLIGLSKSRVEFLDESAETGLTPQTVAVANTGVGQLISLTRSIAYGANQPGGWLTATFSQTTAPAILSLWPNAANLPGGTFNATVSVASPGAGNSPEEVAVMLVVRPAIGLSKTNRNFSVVSGAGLPNAKVALVTNTGGGLLTGLESVINYTSGQPTGWLRATLDRTFAPATLTVQPTTTGLAPGMYHASIQVRSPYGINSPQTVNVRYSVMPPEATAAIGLSKTNRNFTVQNGAVLPNAKTVTVTNAGQGTLMALASVITYASGEPLGWLRATLDRTDAPATLTVQPTTTDLVPGVYHASVLVSSAYAVNSPQIIRVRYSITLPQPAIGLSPASISFGSYQGGSNPASQQVQVNNDGTGTLGGLSASVTYGAGQPSGWLTATLNGSTAPTTMTVQARTGSLLAGTYNAAVSISSAAAGNSPQSISVAFRVNPPAQAPVLSGPATSAGMFTLSWTYNWGGGLASTQNGYELEESTISASAGFARIFSTVNQNDRQSPKTYVLTRSEGSYYYRVRARGNLEFSPWSNLQRVTVTPPPSTTRFVNNSSYPIISLRIDGIEQFPASPLGIVSGQSYEKELPPGLHTYAAHNGFWDGEDRFEMYYYTNTFTQQSGMTGQVAFPDPTIQQLLCRFGNSATWQGDYWLNTVPHWAAFQFFSNGTYKLFDDGVLLQTGTYSLVSRNPQGFNVTFSTSGGAAQGILYELGGYFYMRNGPASWPLIQYVLQ